MMIAGSAVRAWGKLAVDTLADVLARAPDSLPNFDEEDDPVMEFEVEDGWVSLSTIPDEEGVVGEIDISWSETRPNAGDDYDDAVWGSSVYYSTHSPYRDRYVDSIEALDRLAAAVAQRRYKHNG